MSAKDIKIRLIDKPSADKIVKALHYSGKVTKNSQLNFGVFKNGVLKGAAQFGPSIDKRRMASSLGCGMNEVLEINRLAISDDLGKNTESRVLGVCIRMIKKQYPFIRAIVSFADGCQCGDGTIYRAANFKLLAAKKNLSLLEITPKVAKMLSEEAGAKFSAGVVAIKSLDDYQSKGGRYLSSIAKRLGAKPLAGVQFKYIYFIDKTLEANHKFIDFADIPEQARMYKGVRRVEHEGNAVPFQGAEGGSIPTSTLHLCGVNHAKG